MALNTVSSERLSTNVKTSNLGTELKKKVGQNKNIIINGAMQVAQRGTTYTGADQYNTVDRFKTVHSGLNEDVTTAQADVASGTTPYSLGFRKSYKITNGNQTGGAGSNDLLGIDHKIEAQDIANSGWNYVSSSSNITISYWVKSSVAQNFFIRVLTKDGTATRFPFQTGSLSADTWTKVTKTIPGNSNLQFDNNNDSGFEFRFYLFAGTDRTDNSVSLDTWATHNSSANTPDQTSTFYTTDNATFEMTGVQLEVGSTATDFEHRSFAQEALLCKRYYQIIKGNSDLVMFGSGRASGTTAALVATQLAVPLRASPTISSTSYAGWGPGGSSNVTATPTVQSFNDTDNQLNMQFASLNSLSNGRVAVVSCQSGSNLVMDSEL